MLNFFQSSRMELYMYIFNAIVKKFFAIVAIFCCILYIFEILKLFEYLTHGVNFFDWLLYLGINFFTFLPIVLPTSLLISIIIVYNNFFSNNEFLLTSMLNLKYVFYPMLVLSAFVFLFSFQINFFLKPMALYKLKLMRKEFNTFMYKNKESKVFQFGIEDGLFYAQGKSKNDFLNKVFLVPPNKKFPVAISAKKSKIFLNQTKEGTDLMLELYDGKVYNLLDHNPFLYSFEKINIFLQSLSAHSIQLKLKYYTLLDLQSKTLIKDQSRLTTFIYKYKSVNLILSCLSFCLLAWVLLPMNFIRKKWQAIIAFSVVSIFWLLYSLALGWSKSRGFSPHSIYIIPNLWIILVVVGLYKNKKMTALSTRMLSF